MLAVVVKAGTVVERVDSVAVPVSTVTIEGTVKAVPDSVVAFGEDVSVAVTSAVNVVLPSSVEDETSVTVKFPTVSAWAVSDDVEDSVAAKTDVAVI